MACYPKYKSAAVKGWMQLICVLFLVVAFNACDGEVDDIVRGKRFGSPEEAVNTFIDTIRRNDTQGLMTVLGPEAEKLISSGDDAADKGERESFLKKYDEANLLEKDGPDQVKLVVGKEEWPFPIPMIKEGGGWVFDVSAGLEEVLNRRIGRNELDVIDVMKAYVDAQREYYARDRDNDGVREYAQKMLSDEGVKNGLFWRVKAGEDASPFGPLAAEAAREGYDKKAGQPTPYHGYYYKILKNQGPNTAGGEHGFVVNGNMVLGFSMVAYPAEHGTSGIMTFIVNHEDIIYEKDLGEDTAKIAEAMDAYDPDKAWSRVGE